MKEVYFGESSILDLSIGASRPSLTSLLLWQPLPCFVSSSIKAVTICGAWRLKKTCWVESKLQHSVDDDSCMKSEAAREVKVFPQRNLKDTTFFGILWSLASNNL